MRERDEREEDSRGSERDFVPEGALKDCTLKNCFPSLDSSVQAVLQNHQPTRCPACLEGQAVVYQESHCLIFIQSCLCCVVNMHTRTQKSTSVCKREHSVFTSLSPSLLPFTPPFSPHSSLSVSSHIISYVHCFKSPASNTCLSDVLF